MKVAVLYQAQQPPAQEGILKPMKPGGYSDSSADIACTLQNSGVCVVTPEQYPDIEKDLDWTFPDTYVGIQQAISAGADCIWLNTVLYQEHPIKQFLGLHVVGQQPSAVDKYDDKWYTNYMLRKSGLPIPKAELITYDSFKHTKPDVLPPLVAKPIRGRGSEGVTLVSDLSEYRNVLTALFKQDRFGTAVYIEEYLSGEEITITVMPSGNYEVKGHQIKMAMPWCLPGVKRFNHQNGIAPYNGTIAVIYNSQVLTDQEEGSSLVKDLYSNCIEAATLVELKAPIRIDCRANRQGEYFMFDLNMKPNMTGPSRPHRSNQDSLTALAARKMGWDYRNLLINILNQSWQIS
ncbi:ATP-grasp domain-containing protein [Mucilaginibacter sp. CSA2-8R]|uniref:ATP-grasp domain-containing protein n=1 Tax=Mucilaginibacter sp. CSA2-8R TaxID=3141542 RepID=UPI00315DF02B